MQLHLLSSFWLSDSSLSIAQTKSTWILQQGPVLRNVNVQDNKCLFQETGTAFAKYIPNWRHLYLCRYFQRLGGLGTYGLSHRIVNSRCLKALQFQLKSARLKTSGSGLPAFCSRGTGEVLHIQSLLHKGLRTTFRKFPNCNSLIVSWLQLLDFQRDNVT